MSREIKFREPMKCKCGQFRFRYSWWDGKWSWPNFMPVADVCCKSWHYDNIGHIEQYTGLKDKNGVEIWEGDLIKTVDETLKVAWHFNRWVMKDAKGRIKEFRQIDQGFYKVIGNRHQHPQLMEQT